LITPPQAGGLSFPLHKESVGIEKDDAAQALETQCCASTQMDVLTCTIGLNLRMI
jgi:hypothetical protein